MHGGLITDLALVTVVAAATGMLMRRIGQPSVLGYLMAGLIVGPYIPLPVFADPHRMHELSEVGVVLVMFAVGLEFRIRRLLEILPVSGLTGFVQIAALSWAGFMVGSTMLGWSTAASVCLGTTLAISSTMVVSAVLRTRPVDPDVRSHVFGVLVVQDVVAILLMAVVTALAAGETMDARSLVFLVGQLSGVVIAMLVVGLLILPRLVRFTLSLDDNEALVVLVAGAAFGLAMAADMFGYSVALGAFISGMAVAESGRGHDVEEAIEPLRALFSAIFFVSIGMSVDPAVALRTLPLALGLTAVVIGMQFVSVAFSTILTGGSLRKGVYSGFALGQIGELSFILATIGIGGGVLPEETLPALVTVATITAFTTPLFLGRAQSVVETLDRVLPDRAHQVLAAYQSFLRASRDSSGLAPLRRPATALLLDWSALVVVFVVHRTVVPHLEPGVSTAASVAAVAIAAPFVLGLVRSGSKLVVSVRSLARRGGAPTPRAQAVEALVLVAVIIGVGLPTVALVRPLVGGGPWVDGALLFALLVALVLLGLRVGNVSGEYTSGVARLAIDLAGRVGTFETGTQTIDGLAIPDGPLAGIDYHPTRVAEGGPADGMTLAALELRCRTGATVVAICRGDETTTLPTGHELLEAGDVLAVSGSAEALARARVLLEGAPPTPSMIESAVVLPAPAT